MKALSGQAFLLAGKDASKDPYHSLFGTVKAEDATQLGPSKAEAVGNSRVAKVTALGHPLLTTLMGPLKDAQDKLVQADKERDAASDEALAHEVERRKLLKELEAAADLAEVGILTRFPGEQALVNAFLVRKRPTKKEAGTEAPE